MTNRSSARRSGAILLVLPLALAIAACSSAGPSASAAAASGVGGQAPSTGPGAAGVPAIAPGLPEQSPAANASSPEAGSGAGSSGVGVAAGVGASGTGVASAPSIAYPFFGGVSGVAPDHTIVVTGYGQATMQSDGSDRTAARSKALEAAMADARAQADQIAKLAGVSITGVLSVSSSSSGYAYPMPMAANGASGASGAAVPPAAPSGISVLPGAAPIPSRVDLGVSVTIAYSIS